MKKFGKYLTEGKTIYHNEIEKKYLIQAREKALNDLKGKIKNHNVRFTSFNMFKQVKVEILVKEVYWDTKKYNHFEGPILVDEKDNKWTVIPKFGIEILS